LKGSYAVYKKDTLIGEGTGKLCHIHRPEIIDARGRRCWGELAVTGNCLNIIIPEWFLSEAKYPVIVDPTIGTTTVGGQYKWQPDPPEPAEPLGFEIMIPVNRFLISEAINGQCTAYAYVNSDDSYGGGRGVLYSDNGNCPLTRRSSNEQFFELRVRSGQTAGWRSGTFTGSGVTAGQYIWFGICTEDFWFPRFDWGAKCYCDWWDAYVTVPNSYPVYNVNWYEDFKLSMYFTYTSAQNYTRTLTQGVKLTDTRKLTGTYKRTAAQTVKTTGISKGMETFFRKCLMSVTNTMSLKRSPAFNRKAAEQIKATMNISNKRGIYRNCPENIITTSELKRSQGFFTVIQEYIKGTDTPKFPVLFLRSVSDGASIFDTFKSIKAYIRILNVQADNTAETKHEAVLHRFITDTVQAAGTALRSLSLFISIVTGVYIRDYLLRRFLKAREELVLKSKITRDIILESKII
jgi:hypothetical protein